MSSRNTALLALLLLVSSVGCASQHEIRRGAYQAADQVANLQAELQQTIEAETTYYDAAIDSAVAAISRARVLRLEHQLESEARQFVTSQPGGEVTGAQLESFVQSTITQWQSTESDLRAQLTDIQQQLASGRQEISADTAKLSELQNKLRALGEARTRRQLADFVFSFITQTAGDVARLREDSVDDDGTEGTSQDP